MQIPVLYLSLNPETPSRGYWDHGILDDVFENKMWVTPHNFTFDIVDKFKDLKDGGIIVFPARAQVTYVEQLNKLIKPLRWVVIMLTGDEEASFPVEEIKHPNLKVWVMSPRPGRHDQYGKLGTGYPQSAKKYLPKFRIDAAKRPLDYFFSGQVTHSRRQLMAAKLKEMGESSDFKGEFIETAGFTQGLPPALYYKAMAGAKTVPAPSGPETPDSFRLFEALEAGSIPIADTRDPKGVFPDNYWTWFFGEEPPFPVVTGYDSLPGYILDQLENWTAKSNHVFAWWQNKKRQLVYRILRDIQLLQGLEGIHPEFIDKITVIVPTSVIPSHPDTKIIQETIDSIRTHLPTAEIFITFDGVREEQKDRLEDYEEYTRKVLWLCNNKWKNVLPVVFDEHNHQARMLAKVLDKIQTPYLLYVEHDTPITPDRIIEWDKITKYLDAGKADLVRLHHEELVLPDHKHMMLDQEGEFRRTAQWSQRPHIVRVSFYKRLLSDSFGVNDRTMIEDVMHGVVHQSFERYGVEGWYNYRLVMYCPTTDKLGIKRSYHTDGRGTDSKYEMIIEEREHEK